MTNLCREISSSAIGSIRLINSFWCKKIRTNDRATWARFLNPQTVAITVGQVAQTGWRTKIPDLTLSHIPVLQLHSGFYFFSWLHRTFNRAFNVGFAGKNLIPSTVVSSHSSKFGPSMDKIGTEPNQTNPSHTDGGPNQTLWHICKNRIEMHWQKVASISDQTLSTKHCDIARHCSWSEVKKSLGQVDNDTVYLRDFSNLTKSSKVWHKFVQNPLKYTWTLCWGLCKCYIPA